MCQGIQKRIIKLHNLFAMGNYHSFVEAFIYYIFIQNVRLSVINQFRSKKKEEKKRIWGGSSVRI